METIMRCYTCVSWRGDDCDGVESDERGGGMSELEDKADCVSKALRAAWQLGQTYWRQADSDSYSLNKMADETEAKFQKLVDKTRSEIMQAKKEAA